MAEYIERDAAICIADYAADEHPYDKDPAKPENAGEYNRGWNDACDYIRERVEKAEEAEVAPMRELPEWEWVSTEEKLPPLRKVIIALCRGGTIRTMKWSNQDFVWVDCFEAVRLTDDLIVKWIPLPGQRDRETGNDGRN